MQPERRENQATAWLGDMKLFAGLPTRELEVLAAMSSLEVLRDGQSVFGVGEPGRALFVVEKGRVQTFRMKGHKKLIVADLGPGDVFGEMGCVGRCIYHCSAMATEPSQVRILSRAQTEDLMVRHPEFTRKLLNLVSERFLHVLMDLEDTSFRRLIPRIAKLLLERAQGDAVRDLTHQDIAEHVRVYRESATAALGEMKKAGIISVGRRQIRILDRARLERATRE